MQRREFLIGILASGPMLTVASGQSAPAAEIPGTEREAFSAATSVKLTETNGVLTSRFAVNEAERLKKICISDILKPFQSRPGVQEWAGEHVGKWLHAACISWRQSKDPQLFALIRSTATALMSTQEPDGYLGTYVPKDRWTSWDVWSHKYNLLGLLAVYEIVDDAAALTACRRMGDLLAETFGTGRGQRDISSPAHGPQVGMASGSVLEPMVLLYRATGERRYLDFCKYVVESWNHSHGPKIVDGLLRHGEVDRIANRKAYEMLSCLVGVAELYRVTGESRLRDACTAAWSSVQHRHNYPIGTSSWAEVFDERGPDGDYYDARGNWSGTKYAGPGEGCVTVTWLQLNYQMLRLTGEARYADEIERIVYNALIGAQSPRTGQISYFSPLEGRKRYGEVDHGITPDICCCASSLPRGIAMMPALCGGFLGGDPAVVLYEPSVMTYGENDRKLTLEIRGDYPHDEKVAIKVGVAKSSRRTIRLRIPAWAEGFTASVGGNSFAGRPGRFLNVEREWRDGDVIEVKIPMRTRTEPFLDGQVYLRGPQVLAWDKSLRKAKKLPYGWLGRQLYMVEHAGVVLPMVPFADVGQSRADYSAFFHRDRTPATGSL